MIEINGIELVNEHEISYEFIKSSGPGGQNVNKVATAVRLRFNMKDSSQLPDEVKSRLFKIAGNRINKEGILVLTARKHRRQEKNRQEVIEKLKSLILQASQKPVQHKKTKIPHSVRLQRLETKKRRSAQKQIRRSSISLHE
ncbi:aminoacyl-tRNA hydrolase [bacterium]|nr:aminoacyl-tRNA hydrolase [bacterium]